MGTHPIFESDFDCLTEMRFTAVVRRLPPPFYTTVKRKSNLTEFGLEKFRNTELEFETIDGVGRHVKNVTLPFVPDHKTPKSETGGYGEYADYMRLRRISKERRLAWARFGETATDVDVLDLFPSDEEYDAEYKAELEWWRSLDEMKERVAHYESIENARQADLDAQIESGMAQMPKKIEMATKEPPRERIPSIRKPQIRRSVSFDYVKDSLTPEELIYDRIDCKLDPRSMEFQKIMKTERAQIKRQKKLEKIATKEKEA